MTDRNDPTSIDNLRNLAQWSHRIYQKSYVEAVKAHNYYHGDQLSQFRMDTLDEAGIPYQKKNLVKKFTNLITGRATTIVNTTVVKAQREQDVELATILNNIVNFDYRRNAFDTDQGREVYKQGILTGLFSVLRHPVDTGERDEFRRPVWGNLIEYVPAYQLILDPNSDRFDYSDAEWVMRVQWLSENQMKKSFPDINLDDYDRGTNTIQGDVANYLDASDGTISDEYCSRADMFNVVHTVIVDGETTNNNEEKIDKVWSIYWCGDKEIKREEISYRDVKFPYLIFKLHSEDRRNDFYGLYRDCFPHQDSVNDGMLSLHHLLNTGKWFVGPGAFEDIQQAGIEATSPNVRFIQVKDMSQIKDAVTQQDVNNQLAIIQFHEEAFESQLGVNQAFLGAASPGDSGRKLQIQKEATITALNPTEGRLQQFYRQLTRDLCAFISQYYTFHQVYNVSDKELVDRFIEINKPVEILVDSRNNEPIDIQETPQGFFINGQPATEQLLNEIQQFGEMQVQFERVKDPASGKEITDDKGNPIFAPIPTRGTEIRYFRHNIIVDTAVYDNEREVANSFAMNFYNGAGGQLVAQMNPKAYLLGLAKLARGLKTHATNEVAEVFEAAIEDTQAPLNAVGSSPRPSSTEPQ